MMMMIVASDFHPPRSCQGVVVGNDEWGDIDIWGGGGGGNRYSQYVVAAEYIYTYRRNYELRSIVADPRGSCLGLCDDARDTDADDVVRLAVCKQIVNCASAVSRRGLAAAFRRHNGCATDFR